MGWKFVVQENGLLACFSSVVDNFIAWDMSEEEAEKLIVDDAIEQARQRAERMIALAREGGAGRTNDAIDSLRDGRSARTWRKRFAKVPK